MGKCFQDCGNFVHHKCNTGKSHKFVWQIHFSPSYINAWLWPSGNDSYLPWNKRNPSIHPACTSGIKTQRKAPQELNVDIQTSPQLPESHGIPWGEAAAVKTSALLTASWDYWHSTWRNHRLCVWNLSDLWTLQEWNKDFRKVFLSM